MSTEDSQLEQSRNGHKGTMHKVFKLLAWVNGLAAVSLALLLALPSFIDWGQYKGKIIHLAQDKLGANVKIEGAVYAQFLPAPVFRLNRVTISHSAMPNRNPLTVKRVDVELDFFDLIKGDITPQAVLLKGADIVFGMTENKTLTLPLGLMELFEGKGGLGVSHFGVSEASVYFMDQAEPARRFVDEISFLATKTDDNQNWSFSGHFMSQQTRHDFQLVTRARPEKKITFIDTQVKMTSGGNLTHSFNGSLSKLDNDAVLEGRYRSAGRIGSVERSFAISSSGRIRASHSLLEMTGFTFSATSTKNKDETSAPKPMIMNAEFKAKKTPHAGRWALKGQVSSENLVLDHISGNKSGGAGYSSFLNFANSIATSMDGQVSMRARNTFYGRDLYPSFYANLALFDDLIHISDAGLALPDGGRLQTDRMTAYKSVRDEKEVLEYQGAVFFKTENVKDIARILPSMMKAQNLKNFSDRPNQISMSGLLKFSENSLVFDSKNIKINGSSGRVGVRIKGGKTPQNDVSFSLDKINVDHFLKTSDKNVLDVIAMIAHSHDAQGAGDHARQSHYKLRIDKILWRGTSLNDVVFDGEFSKKSAYLKKMTIGGLDDQSLTLNASGRLRGMGAKPHGALDISLSSPQALDALSLIAPKFLVSESGKHFARRSHLVSPFKLNAKIFTKKDQHNTWQVKLDGRMSTTQFSSEGAFYPNWESTVFAPKELDMQFELSNPSSRYLASQFLDMSSSGLESIPETEGFMRASVSGTGMDGFDIALGGEVSDLQLTLGGTAKLDDNKTSLAAQVKLFSPQSRALLNFAGLTKPGDYGKTEYVANLVGSGQQYILSGGHGTIGGRSLSLDAKLDLSPQKPVLSAHFGAERIRSQSIKRVFSSLIDTKSAFRSFGDLFATHVSVASPLLSLHEGVDVSHAEAQLKLNRDYIQLTSFKGKLYGGNLLMNGRADHSSDGISFSTQYELQDAELNRALLQENQDKVATGKFTMAGEISASADKLANLKRSLKGRGYVKAGKGGLRGMNPAAFGRSVRFVSNGTELDGMIGGILSEGQIPFSKFQTAFQIENGVLRTDKTQLISREVRSQNKTQIDLVSGEVQSDWHMQLTRLPKTPALTLTYSGKVHNLKRSLEHRKLRAHLMALMRKGENLSKRFAVQTLPTSQGVDQIQTGSLKRKMMKKPLKLDGLSVVPQINPLRGSH